MPTFSELDERRLKKWLGNLNGHDSELSASSAEKLGKLGHPGAVPDLIKAMENRVSMVSAAAAQALGEIKDKSAVPSLLKVARGHNDSVVQTAAMKALGEIGDERAVPVLEGIIDEYLRSTSGDRLSRIRGFNYALLDTAVYSLRRIGTPRALRAAKKADQL